MPEREGMLVRGELSMLRGDGRALDGLRAATETYPDDPEAWYLYADALFHLGSQRLVGNDEIRQALERVIALDPGFAPGYLHLIDMAFGDADSAAARRLIDRHLELAPDSEPDALHELTFRLAFGTPAARDAALAAVDTVSGRNARIRIGLRLWHPRFAEVQQRLFVDHVQASASPGGPGPVVLVFNLLNQGKVRDALRWLDELPLPREFVASVTFLIIGEGFHVPEERVARVLAVELPDSVGDAAVFFQALHAAGAGRWDEVEQVVGRARAAVPRLQSAGDSATARLVDGAADGLEGYALARRGETARGIEMLERSLEQATGYGVAEGVNSSLRWATAQVLEDAGRWEEALRYWESFGDDPLASWHLARVYEELGEYEEAREEYELFAYAWRNADPELQPRVQEARAAARRLTDVTRE
jgi:tetratricopeptide (TPR) repeat protein